MEHPTIEIEGRDYVLLPREHYEEMVAHAAGGDLPEPLRAVGRGLNARGILTDRLAAGWTQEELAERAGVSVETISRLEGGKHRPQAATVEKIDQAFKQAAVA